MYSDDRAAELHSFLAQQPEMNREMRVEVEG